MKLLFCLFCITLPMTDVSSPITSQSVPTFGAFILFIVLFLSGKVSQNLLSISKQDFIYLLFFLSSVCSLLLSVQGADNQKVINHFLARPLIFIIYYWSVRLYIENQLSADRNYDFLKWVLFGVVLSCFYCVFEFIEMNIMHTNFLSFIPRLNSELEYGATAIGTIIRSRSLVEESGHFAFYLELIGPLVLYYTYITYGKIHLYMLMALLLLSVLLTMSSTTFIILPLGILLSALICRIRLIKIITFAFDNLFSTICFILLTIISYYTFIPLLISEVVNKFTVGDIGGRAPRILDAWNVMLEASFAQWIFGYGPASFYHFGLDGILSLYMSCLFELGLAGLFLLLLFISYSFKYALRVPDISLKYTLVLSLILSVLHFSIIQNYWYPWFWFVIAFISSSNTCSNILITHQKRNIL